MADAPYRLEPAKSDRSSCSVSKEKIEKGEIRFGSFMNMGGKGSYKWRKLASISAKQVTNVKETLGGPGNVDGFTELSAEEQSTVCAAFEAATAAAAAAGSISSSSKAPKTKKPAASPEGDEASPPLKKAKKSTAKKVLASSSSGSLGICSKVVAVPATLTDAIIASAHKLIDLAKSGSWVELCSMLDAEPNLVNVRPEVREYSVLQQASYHGQVSIVSTLLSKYGADPSLHTKHGQSAVQVAKEQGHMKVVEVLAAHLSQLVDEPAGSTYLTPEKVDKHSKLESIPVVPIPALTPEITKAAHGLITKAKSAQWDELFETLDSQKELVNVRPDVRDYSILHQAAYHDDGDAINTLIHKYGADPCLKTGSGLSLLEVAEMQGCNNAIKAIKKLPSTLSAEVTDDGDDMGAEDEDDGFEVLKMPDGSWKVMPKASSESSGAAAPAATPAVAPAAPPAAQPAASLVAPPAPPPAAPPAATPATPAAAVASSHAASSSSRVHAPRSTSARSAPYAAVAGAQKAAAGPAQAAAAGVAGSASSSKAKKGFLVDFIFPAADECRVYQSEGTTWHAMLKRANQFHLIQLIEVNADSYCVWNRWGKTDTDGEHEGAYFASPELAGATFKSKFHEKTNNKWESRKSFKPYFGKYTYKAEPGIDDDAATSSMSPPMPRPVPALTPDVVQQAHKLIDLAKAGRWPDLFKMLEAHKALVNVRPEARDFSALHQAAFQGKAEVVLRLIDECGADPSQCTKFGKSAAEVAFEQGFTELAEKVGARLKKPVYVAGG